MAVINSSLHCFPHSRNSNDVVCRAGMVHGPVQNGSLCLRDKAGTVKHFFNREARWALTPLDLSHGSDRILRGAFVVRAKHSRFTEKYKLSSQDSIDRLAKILCETGSVAETLKEYGTKMKPPDWFNVLEGVGRRRRWLVALEIFRWVQTRKWYTPDNGYYSKLISIMGKERQYRMAMTMFMEMKKVGCRPDTSLYNSVMTVHLRSEDKQKGFERACALLEEMKLRRRCLPNIVTFNILTRAAAQMGLDEKMKFFFKDMLTYDATPDHYTYNGIMDAYGKAGEISKMEDIFKRMRYDKLKPDLVTFNILIDAYGKAGEFEKMNKVVASMAIIRKPPVRPTVKTYNSMIHNYGNAGLVEKFEGVFADMKHNGVEPSFITYEAMIGAYGISCQFDKMKIFLHKMREVSLIPQSSTLNKMLDIYCRHDMTTEAETLLANSVKEFGIEPTSLSYAIVIRAHRKAGRGSQMLDLLYLMKPLGLKPTKETYFDVLEVIGMDLSYTKRQHDETAGTLSDLDSLSSLNVKSQLKNRNVLSSEKMAWAAV